jgi:DNA polymerase-3 subunit epsilon
MKGKAWLILAANAGLEIGVLIAAGWLLWHNFGPQERSQVAALWTAYAGIPLVAAVFLLLLLAIGGNVLYSLYIRPLRRLAEETRVIAMSNPRRRLQPAGGAEMRELIASLNLWAERYQHLQEEVERRIQDANAALEEEKNTLATLMAKLTQGVLVCSREGRIILYNPRAQMLLEGPARRSGVGDWIGLGRSIYGVLEEKLIDHALSHIDHRLRQGDSALLAPFLATRPGGQLLSVHLVPVLDRERALTGYILTLEDITRRTATESRRGVLLQSLTEGQRSSIAGIRAAIETVLGFPDMDDASRQQFLGVIGDEAVKLSRHLDQLETDYSRDLAVQWPLDDMPGSDLLAAVERRLRDALAIDIEVSAPLEPLWLKVDSYALVQAVGFVAERLQREHDAGHFALKLETQGGFGSFRLFWKGAPLEMETLRAWGKQDILIDRQGSALNLHDIIERHSGAAWSTTDPASGIHCLQLLLPLADDDPLRMGNTGTDEPGHDYDFRLLDQPRSPADLLETPLMQLSYTVIDTEATGLNPSDGDEIIAIGAVRIVNGRIPKREIFDCLINPRRPMAAAAVEVHGISPAMLRGMPTIDEVLPQFHRFVEDTVIVGHNVAFDMRFFELKEARTGIKFTNPVLDTLLLAWAVHPNQEEQSLETIAARLGITVTGRHTALGDALATAEVLLALIPLLAERGIHTLAQAQAAAAATDYARLKY